ncbi:MAG: ARMT1-like domain-containing protein [Phycisphaerales bacterium]
MPTLPLLASPATYNPHTIDMVADPEARHYWIDVFVNHLPSLKRHAIISEGDTDDARRRVDAMAAQFSRMLDTLRAKADAFGHLSILRICELREQCLREHHIADPYSHIKLMENEACLKLLPGVLAELDAMRDPRKLLETLIVGVFAGNVFDLGAAGTLALYESGKMDYHDVRAKIKPRPWVVDDLGLLEGRWLDEPLWKKAMVLVDNAGADVVLGMIPLCRELAKRGTQVFIAANTYPSLNDITFDALGPLLERIAVFDEVVRDALRDRRITPIASGNDAPLIDLRHVSEELAAAARGADLLILEGMGRAIESNFDAAFTCDTLKLAMIKEKHVAQTLHAEMYDVVCRFEPALSDER